MPELADEQSILSMKPGEIIQLDYRTEDGKKYAKSNCFDRMGTPLKMVTWNIERGYKMDEITIKLKEINADVICLQEVDAGCSRSNYIDTGIALAKALNMMYVFQLEFIELGSGVGSPYSTQDGVHGNGVLTRFDVKEVDSIDHAFQPYNWDRDGHLFNEPRVGRRFTLCAVIQVPAHFNIQYAQRLAPTDVRHSLQQGSSSRDTAELLKGSVVVPRFFNLAVYTCHLELFCGATDRVNIISEIFVHSRAMFARGVLYQTVCGDFNALAHSIARFSPNYCKDALRVGSVGWCEGEWLTAHVLDYYDDDALTDVATHKPQLWSDLFSSPTKVSKHKDAVKAAVLNTRLADMGLGLSEEVLRNIINPGFEDVFPPNTETLTNYKGWFYGKLDFFFTRGCSVVAREVKNRSYRASDHRALVVEAFLDTTKLHTCGKIYHREVLGDLTVDEAGENINYNDDLVRTIIVHDAQNISHQFDVVPCAIRGYYLSNQGLVGYYNRNCSPFVKLLAVICIILFLLLDLLVF